MTASGKTGTDRTRSDVDFERFPPNGHNGSVVAAPGVEQPRMLFETNSPTKDHATTHVLAAGHVSERKVVRWVAAYVAAGAMLLQVMEALSHMWNVPLVVQRGVSLGLLLGVPHAVVVAWYHGEKGRQKVCTREVACIAIFTLAAAFVLHVTLR